MVLFDLGNYCISSCCTSWFSPTHLWRVCAITPLIHLLHCSLVIQHRIVTITNRSSCLLGVGLHLCLRLIPWQPISFAVVQFEVRSFWPASHQESGCYTRVTWMPARKKNILSRYEWMKVLCVRLAVRFELLLLLLPAQVPLPHCTRHCNQVMV